MAKHSCDTCKHKALCDFFRNSDCAGYLDCEEGNNHAHWEPKDDLLNTYIITFKYENRNLQIVKSSVVIAENTNEAVKYFNDHIYEIFTYPEDKCTIIKICRCTAGDKKLFYAQGESIWMR